MELSKTLKRYYNYIYQNKIRRRLFKIFLGAFLWCIIVLPTYFAYSREGDKIGSLLKVPSESNITKDGLYVQIDLLSIDPLNKKAELFVQLDPEGGWSFTNKTIRHDIQVNLRYKRKEFSKGIPIEPFKFTTPFTIGNLRDYPFENFMSFLPIEILYKNQDKNNELSLVPLRMEFYGISQLFRIRFRDITEDTKPEAYFDTFTINDSSKIFTILITRPTTTLLICTFMIILMWCLAIATISIAIEAVFDNREIPPPILGTSVAMLFALPALRNTQPGIPAMGCKSDILGFFWSLVLIAIAAVSLLFKWLLNRNNNVPPLIQKKEME